MRSRAYGGENESSLVAFFSDPLAMMRSDVSCFWPDDYKKPPMDIVKADFSIATERESDDLGVIEIMNEFGCASKSIAIMAKSKRTTPAEIRKSEISKNRELQMHSLW